MAFLEDARSALGLPDDATEETILAALKTKTETPTDPEPEPAEPAVEPKAEEPEAQLSAPATVTVSKAVFDEMQATLNRLDSEAQARRRTAVIETALSEGRIVPAERAQWETALLSAPEATENLIQALPARVNVTETGSEVALSAKADATPELDTYLDRLFSKGA